MGAVLRAPCAPGGRRPDAMRVSELRDAAELGARASRSLHGFPYPFGDHERDEPAAKPEDIHLLRDGRWSDIQRRYHSILTQLVRAAIRRLPLHEPGTILVERPDDAHRVDDLVSRPAVERHRN